jgi:hypothetical protein
MISEKYDLLITCHLFHFTYSELVSMELTDLQTKHESTRDKVAQLGRFL